MKQNIIFNADEILLSYIKHWQDYLLKERLFSTHTLDAYGRDFAIFLKIIGKDKKLSISDLQNLDVRDFRYFFKPARFARY